MELAALMSTSNLIRRNNKRNSWSVDPDKAKIRKTVLTLDTLFNDTKFKSHSPKWKHLRRFWVGDYLFFIVGTHRDLLSCSSFQMLSKFACSIQKIAYRFRWWRWENLQTILNKFDKTWKIDLEMFFGSQKLFAANFWILLKLYPCFWNPFLTSSYFLFFFLSSSVIVSNLRFFSFLFIRFPYS